MDFNTVGSLRARITILETELSAARLEIERLKDGALYLLNIRSSSTCSHGNSTPGSDGHKISKLLHEIRQLGFENQSLRDQVAQCSQIDSSIRNLADYEPLIDLDDDQCELMLAADDSDQMDKTYPSNKGASIAFKSMIDGAAEWESSTPKPTSGTKVTEVLKSNKETPVSMSLNSPSIPRHLLKSLPSNSSTFPCCAILITDIPLSVTYSQLFARIRGGPVLFAQLGDTSSITGSKTAFVRFVSSESARRFVEGSRKNPPFFRTADEIVLSIGRVDLVGSPSAPIDPNLASAIESRGLSRCFSLMPPYKLTANMDVEGIVSKAAGKHRLVHMGVVESGAIHVECTGIEAAVKTQTTLICSVFTGCASWFEKDPCDRAVEGFNMDDEDAYIAEETPRCDGYEPAGRVELKVVKNPDEIELIDNLNSSDDCRTIETPQDSGEDEAEQHHRGQSHIPARWNLGREIQLAKTVEIITK